MSHKLIEIPRSQWIKLRNLYVEHKKSASGYNLLQILLDWDEQNVDLNLKIYSLDGVWEDDGTFVAILYLCQALKQVYCNTLSDNFERLVAALNCVNIEEIYLVFGFPERIKPAVQEHYKRKNVGSDEFKPDGTFWQYISKEKALRFSTDPPTGITLARLKVEHAEQVNTIWPHRAPGSVEFVKHLIRYNDSVGAFDKGGNLVAWCLILPIGSLGVLHVLDTHKRQGLGSLIVRYMSKLIAGKDLAVTAPVVFENQPSLAMFKNLGFEIIDKTYWVVLQAKEE